MLTEAAKWVTLTNMAGRNLLAVLKNSELFPLLLSMLKCCFNIRQPEGKWAQKALICPIQDGWAGPANVPGSTLNVTVMTESQLHFYVLYHSRRGCVMRLKATKQHTLRPCDHTFTFHMCEPQSASFSLSFSFLLSDRLILPIIPIIPIEKIGLNTLILVEIFHYSTPLQFGSKYITFGKHPC